MTLYRCENWKKCNLKGCSHQNKHEHRGSCDYLCGDYQGVSGSICIPVPEEETLSPEEIECYRRQAQKPDWVKDKAPDKPVPMNKFHLQGKIDEIIFNLNTLKILFGNITITALLEMDYKSCRQIRQDKIQKEDR